MKPLDQIILDSGRGDCRRACVASILNLEMEQVPHFRLYSVEQEQELFYYFMYALGWVVEGYAPYNPYNEQQKIDVKDSIDGYFLAVVPSKNLAHSLHSVIIDVNGLVVHDPHPKKKYQNENVFDSKNIKYWYIFSKRTEKRC